MFGRSTVKKGNELQKTNLEFKFLNLSITSNPFSLFHSLSLSTVSEMFKQNVIGSLPCHSHAKTHTHTHTYLMATPTQPTHYTILYHMEGMWSVELV